MIETRMPGIHTHVTPTLGTLMQEIPMLETHTPGTPTLETLMVGTHMRDDLHPGKYLSYFC